MNTPKRPGRPRVYEDAATKLSMFRERQAASGYLRKEVLVTAETADQLKALASAHQVGVSDVASAMLEQGLQAFLDARQAPVGAVGFASAQPLAVFAATQSLADMVAGPELVAAVTPAAAAQPLENPITRFFQRRKEQQNEQR